MCDSPPWGVPVTGSHDQAPRSTRRDARGFRADCESPPIPLLPCGAHRLPRDYGGRWSIGEVPAEARWRATPPRPRLRSRLPARRRRWPARRSAAALDDGDVGARRDHAAAQAPPPARRGIRGGRRPNAASGFRRGRTWRELIIDALEGTGLSVLIAAGMLFLLGRLELDHGIPTLVGASPCYRSRWPSDRRSPRPC